MNKIPQKRMKQIALLAAVIFLLAGCARSEQAMDGEDMFLPAAYTQISQEEAGEMMGRDEEILLGAPLDEVECGKSGKPAAIAREIGKRPVLAFGNSAGDYSMLNYAEGNNSMGSFVVCDDVAREYGSDEKAAKYYAEAEKEGWTAFSMANDWKTIYGDGVRKTELPGSDVLELAA